MDECNSLIYNSLSFWIIRQHPGSLSSSADGKAAFGTVVVTVQDLVSSGQTGARQKFADGPREARVALLQAD